MKAKSKEQTTTVNFKKGTKLAEHPEGLSVYGAVKKVTDLEDIEIVQQVFAEKYETVTLRITYSV